MKCEKQDDQSDGISIQNIGGVFIVIFVGIALACITLAFEYWWYKYRKSSNVINVQEAPKSDQHRQHDTEVKAIKPKKFHGQLGDDGGVKMPKVYQRQKF